MVLSSWSYKEPLCHSYLLPNIKIIRKIISDECVIYLQTSEKKNLRLTKQEENEVSQQLADAGIVWKPLPYRNFGMSAIFLYIAQIIRLTFFIHKKKIDVLHPFAASAGTMALFLKKITRKKMVLDSWEPHAECMVQTGAWSENSLAFRILWWSEKMQAKYADVLIAASKGMVQYSNESYGIAVKHVLLRPACVDLQIFNASKYDRVAIREKLELTGKVVCACVSKLGGLYLRHDVFRLFKTGQDVFGESFHVLLLSENSREEVLGLCHDSGFDSSHLTHLSVPHSDVPAFLIACDFAFNPQQPVPAKRYGTPVKDGEYWAMGLPIIILPEISEDSMIVKNENAGVILADLNVSSMTNAMQQMQFLLSSNPEIRSQMRKIAEQYRSYEIAEQTYRQLYSGKMPLLWT